jgi:hypothetical protein
MTPKPPQEQSPQPTPIEIAKARAYVSDFEVYVEQHGSVFDIRIALVNSGQTPAYEFHAFTGSNLIDESREPDAVKKMCILVDEHWKSGHIGPKGTIAPGQKILLLGQSIDLASYSALPRDLVSQLPDLIAQGKWSIYVHGLITYVTFKEHQIDRFVWRVTHYNKGWTLSPADQADCESIDHP